MMSKPKKRNSGIVQRRASTANADPRGPDRAKKLIGMGTSDSGIPDFGSKKKYMEGFGQKSMGRKER
jgi:hypothetical protein